MDANSGLRKAGSLLMLLALALVVQGGLEALAQKTENVEAIQKQFMELYQSGKYEQAIRIAKQVLEFREKTSGPDDPATATSLLWLAASYSEMRDYAKAEPLYLRALNINEKVLGPQSLNTAATLHNLAWLYQSMGDLAKAEPLCQRALKIYEKACGPEHRPTSSPHAPQERNRRPQ